MPNTYYNRSKRKEQELVREAKKEGKIALRSAGSKSPIDVVIIDRKNKLIQLLQVKTGTMSESALLKLSLEFNDLNSPFEVQYAVCHFP
jgi:Holliday junction resolvase